MIVIIIHNIGVKSKQDILDKVLECLGLAILIWTSVTLTSIITFAGDI